MTAPVIGVDPGLSGAIAVIAGGHYAVYDTPVIAAGRGSYVKNTVNWPEFADIVARSSQLWGTNVALVVIERVNAFPGQGVSSMFSLGMSYGGAQGVAAAFGLPARLVAPQDWKRHYKLTADKEEARALAMRLFPHADLGRKKDHGRAEALLIARYGQETR